MRSGYNHHKAGSPGKYTFPQSGAALRRVQNETGTFSQDDDGFQMQSNITMPLIAWTSWLFAKKLLSVVFLLSVVSDNSDEHPKFLRN